MMQPRFAPPFLFLVAYVMYLISISTLFSIDICRFGANETYTYPLCTLLGTATKLTGEPVPMYRGLPTILVALVYYRLVVLGFPSFLDARQWSGFPFPRAVPTMRVKITEFCSHVAILHLGRLIIKTLLWTKAALLVARQEKSEDLAIMLGAAVGKLAADYLMSCALIMYVATAWDQYKEFKMAFPDVFEQPLAIVAFVCLLCVHLFS
ncbi:hypothetical protein F5Y06DRAFT_299768 [Hypoxylon sp. FL0890]|nr:hypothetical protein F5Y06DRAFT_299768 [Hypoxylon sp. FL0890]